MKFATGLFVLAIALCVIGLWATGVTSEWASTGLVMGVAVGVAAVVWIAKMWLRNRRRRQLTDTRDSALW